MVFMIIVIMNPTSPKARMPKADTFDTNLNSWPDGFLKILQTLMDCVMKDLNFWTTIQLNRKMGF